MSQRFLEGKVVKILVVGPSWIGDMVIAQSLYMVLKQSVPDLQLHVLTMPWSQTILQRMPEVDQAHPLPVGHGELALKKRFRLARTLRQENLRKLFSCQIL